MDRKKFDKKELEKYRLRERKRRKERGVGKKEAYQGKPSRKPKNINIGKVLKQQKPMPEPISPGKRKMLNKQKQDQMVKQNLTQDYAYTGTPGAIAEPAGVTIPAPKKPKLALRGGGRAYGRNS